MHKELEKVIYTVGRTTSAERGDVLSSDMERRGLDGRVPLGFALWSAPNTTAAAGSYGHHELRGNHFQRKLVENRTRRQALWKPSCLPQMRTVLSLIKKTLARASNYNPKKGCTKRIVSHSRPENVTSDGRIQRRLHHNAGENRQQQEQKKKTSRAEQLLHLWKERDGTKRESWKSSEKFLPHTSYIKRKRKSSRRRIRCLKIDFAYEK